MTGGHGDIGSAIVDKLSLEGRNVISPSSKELNLSSTESISAWVEQNRGIDINAFVAVAGINFPKLLVDQDVLTLQEILQINVLGHYQLLNLLLPKISKSKNPRIVFISSAYAIKARQGRSAYSMSKAALDSLMKSIAVEFSEVGLLANSVAPGFVETRLTRQNNSVEEIMQINQKIPLGRLSLPNEIANLVHHLTSPENTYITGQVINVDGGLSVT